MLPTLLRQRIAKVLNRGVPSASWHSRLDCRPDRRSFCQDLLRLALETAMAFRIGGRGIREDFEGNVAFQSRITRAIDLTHPARAERADVVRPEARAWRDRHCFFVGAIRRNSSKKFVIRVTWLCASGGSGRSAGRSTANRFQSGARSKLGVRPVFANRASDHTRGLSATNMSSFTA